MTAKLFLSLAVAFAVVSQSQALLGQDVEAETHPSHKNDRWIESVPSRVSRASHIKVRIDHRCHYSSAMSLFLIVSFSPLLTAERYSHSSEDPGSPRNFRQFKEDEKVEVDVETNQNFRQFKEHEKDVETNQK
jgi:hypothetical protein